MEAGTIAPGASAEQQKDLADKAREADAGAVEHDARGGESDAGGFEPDAEGAGEEEQELLNLAIQGEGQLTLTVGGAKPEVSTVKLIGGKMDVSEGDFDKGAEIKLLIHARVSSVEFVDTYDQYGNLSGTERRHKVRPLRVERLRD